MRGKKVSPKKQTVELIFWWKKSWRFSWMFRKEKRIIVGTVALIKEENRLAPTKYDGRSFEPLYKAITIVVCLTEHKKKKSLHILFSKICYKLYPAFLVNVAWLISRTIINPCVIFAYLLLCFFWFSLHVWLNCWDYVLF